jgi:hypothetical protein
MYVFRWLPTTTTTTTTATATTTTLLHHKHALLFTVQSSDNTVSVGTFMDKRDQNSGFLSAPVTR